MKSTICIVEITNQKNENYLYMGRNPVVWSPPHLLAACQLRNFPHVFLLKSVLPFLTNQAVRFTSCGIGRCYFSGNFLLSFLLWYDFKILVKSRGGGTFLSLAPSVSN